MSTHNRHIDPDTLEKLRKKARLLSVSIDGLYSQVSGDRLLCDVEQTFLPVQELSWEVDSMTQEIYSANGETKAKKAATPNASRGR